MQVGVIGINHKLADLQLRECFAKICYQRFSSGACTHCSHIIALLNTCNRTEVYFSSEELAETHSYVINILRRDLQDIEEYFDQKLYSYFGHDCFKHLARVTAGLDSAIIAETEIQGQVKAAYENAIKYLPFPREMHYLFQKALKIGKQIRFELPLERGLPSLEHAILNAGLHTFEALEQTKVLMVGASEINRKILSFLKTKNLHHITLCNRSPGPAKTIAAKYSLDVLPWTELHRWTDYDMIIFGTKSPNHVITNQILPGTNKKLIIDLCVPRNVDPKLGKNPHITLLNIDQINRTLKIRKRRIQDFVWNAEEIVHSLTQRQIDLFHEKEEKRLRYLAAC